MMSFERLQAFDRWTSGPGWLPRVVSAVLTETLIDAWLHREDPEWQCVTCHWPLVHPWVCDRCGWRIDDGRLEDERDADDWMAWRPLAYRVWRTVRAGVRWAIRVHQRYADERYARRHPDDALF